MKKDRSNHKLTKADFEKFADYDTRFYGLFYTKTDNGIKVKIDPKRMKSMVSCKFSDEQLKIINRRRTHYFYPKKSEYYDYCCNMFVDRIKDIKNYWEEHYKNLIIFAKKRIDKPKEFLYIKWHHRLRRLRFWFFQNKMQCMTDLIEIRYMRLQKEMKSPR